MLVIRAAQMAALEQARWDAFVDTACAYASAHWPHEPEPRARVERALARGRGHGLVAEFDLLRWVGLDLALGADFERDPARPWAAEVLGARAYAPGPKVDLLWQLAHAALGGVAGADAPTEYEDGAEEDADGGEPAAELPDVEVLPLDDDPAEPFEPASEDAPELPPDEPFATSDEDAAE